MYFLLFSSDAEKARKEFDEANREKDDLLNKLSWVANFLVMLTHVL